MVLTRATIFESVVMRLSILRYVVRARSKRNLTDVNRQCEKFFRDVLNLTYGYELVDINEDEANSAAIDLGDELAGICFQITATSASAKVDDTIEKFIKYKLYEKYKILKVLMLVEKKRYTKNFDTQGRFAFNHKKDIWDIDDILDTAENLSLERLQTLSAYLDANLHPLTRSLLPESLLAKAEAFEPKPPTNSQRFLEAVGCPQEGIEWAGVAKAIGMLHTELSSLSRNQREIIAYIVENGREGRFGGRISFGIQTLQQKLGLSEEEMRDYYRALEGKGLLDVDGEEGVAATNFEVSYSLAREFDAFPSLKEFLKGHDQYWKVLVDCDFSLLDSPELHSQE